MYQDISVVKKTGCNVLGNNQITNYTGNVREVYYLYGNKYMLTSRNTSTYNYDTSSYICYTDLTNKLQSNYDYIMPVYNVLATSMAILLFYTAYSLIIKKWWRRV